MVAIDMSCIRTRVPEKSLDLTRKRRGGKGQVIRNVKPWNHVQ